MSTSRLLNDNDNQQAVNETMAIVLTAEQKIIFKKFIDALIDDNELKNLLIRDRLWLKTSGEITTKFWSNHGNMLSHYHGLSTIPLIPEVRDTLEEFFLRYPEALDNSYLEDSTALNTPHTLREHKPYSLLKRLPDFLQTWALENNQHAKLIANHPELYKHSNENIEKEKSLTDSRWYKFTATYFLIAAIAFAAVAVVGLTWLAGAGAFIFLALGSAYLAYRSTKQAKIAPVAELADTLDVENEAANDANVPEHAPEQEKTVQVSMTLTGNAEQPVQVNIGPFFQTKPVTPPQHHEELKKEHVASPR